MIAVAVLATIASPNLVYVGPRVAEPKFEQAFDAAISACGLAPSSVQRRYATLREEPATLDQRAAQENEVIDVALRAGFAGPEAEHQVTFQVIRALLQTRTFMRLKTTAEPSEGQCLVRWLSTQGFAPVQQDQLLPAELRD